MQCKGKSNRDTGGMIASFTWAEVTLINFEPSLSKATLDNSMLFRIRMLMVGQSVVTTHVYVQLVADAIECWWDWEKCPTCEL